MENMTADERTSEKSDGLLRRIKNSLVGEKREPEQEPMRVGGVGEDTDYVAAQHTQLPLSPFMTRLMAQELPILDSTSRRRVNQLLREYEGPTIEDVEELPKEIRDIMELY